MKLCRRLIRTTFLVLAPATAFLLVSQLLRATAELTTLKVIKTDDHLPMRQTSTQEIIPEETGRDNPPFIKLLNDKAYLYSAIFITRRDKDSKQISTYPWQFNTEVVVNGWERKGQLKSNFACCILLSNKKMIMRVAKTQKVHWFLQSKLQATQFRCASSMLHSDVTGVSITYGPTCSKNATEYITISELEVSNSVNRVDKPNVDTGGNVSKVDTSNPRIGVCAKLAFGDLDARKLIEWFEVHRMFGVDTVIAYSYKLNSMARKVFDHYETLGMSKVFEFDIPEKETIVRDVGVKNVQSWNDEQVALYDCQERLQGYDYVAVMDTDEFMVPNTNDFRNAWTKFFKQQFQKPYLSGLIFKVQVHVTTWEKNEHPLLIGQYINSTNPMYDRVKEVYMPSRVIRGSVSTHHLKPIKTFTRKYVNPKLATIHHFRTCRKEWLKSADDRNNVAKLTNGTEPAKKRKPISCTTLQQYPSKLMEKLANAVKSQVLLANKNINLRP